MACPPSRGSTGRRLKALHPNQAQTSAPPMTRPTTGPAREMLSDRSRDRGPGGTNVVTPPNPARAICGLAPAALAVTACPSSCTSTATGVMSSQMTMSRIEIPGR
jgi:hypothetical protein